jgi:hypothetical protein
MMGDHTLRTCHFGYISGILIAVTFAGGCIGTYYIPGRMLTSQFDSSHDTYLTAGYGVGGWQTDIAVVPITNFWMTGHVAYLPFSDSIEVPSRRLNDQGFFLGSSLGELHGEFGLGWYSAGQGEQFGLLTGYGRGTSAIIRLKTDINYSDTIEPAPEVGRGDFETYFLQASGVSLITDPHMYARLLLRGEYLRFTQFSLERKDQPLPTALLIEPRIFFGTSFPEFPGLQCEVQMGIQFRAGGRERFDFVPLHISLALLGLLDLF